MNNEPSYRRVMEDHGAALELKLNVHQPIEVRDLGALLGSYAGQFDDFIKESQPNAEASAKFYVKSIREGCIEIEFIGWAIGMMDSAMILRDFGRYNASLLKGYIKGKPELPDTPKHRTQAAEVLSVLAQNEGDMAITYHNRDGDRETTFTAVKGEATAGMKDILQRQLDSKPEVKRDPHKRVLMRFFATNLKTAASGKRSGDQIIIAMLDSKPKPIAFQSDYAQERVKSEIAEAEDNIYKKGFIVDVLVESHGDKIMLYWITEVHAVVDLPDDVAALGSDSQPALAPPDDD